MYTLDPKRLGLSNRVIRKAMAGGSRPPPRHKPGSEFLKGPVPLAWLRRAASLPGKVLAVCLALWFKAGATNRREVRLTGKLATRFHVGRKAAARCLKSLEAAGLVSVARHPGRSPVVTILDAPEESQAA